MRVTVVRFEQDSDCWLQLQTKSNPSKTHSYKTLSYRWKPIWELSVKKVLGVTNPSRDEGREFVLLDPVDERILWTMTKDGDPNGLGPTQTVIWFASKM